MQITGSNRQGVANRGRLRSPPEREKMNEERTQDSQIHERPN